MPNGVYEISRLGTPHFERHSIALSLIAPIEHDTDKAVEFIAEDESSAGGGPGVRLAKPMRRKRAK